MNQISDFFSKQQWTVAAASTAAPQVDRLVIILVIGCSMMALSVFAALIVFILKYRDKKRIDRTRRPRSPRKLEMALAAIPLVFSLVMFTLAAKAYFFIFTPPSQAADVYVVAKQWMWKFYGPGDQKDINRLRVPLGKPIRLVMTSEDVIHSFFVPEFRIKEDVLPGRYTSVWFQASKKGTYNIRCTQYCGTSHASMLGTIEVVDAAEIAPAAASETKGRRLFVKYQCQACHESGVRDYGPSLQHLYLSEVTLQDGRRVLADDDYIRQSIQKPQSQMVRGYRAVMPPYVLNEGELRDLAAYIKSLAKRL